MAGMVDVASSVKAAVSLVESETFRAINLHGAMHSLHEAHSVLEEEFDEFWDNVKMNPRKMSLEQVKKWRHDLREELVQTAAMCVRTLIDCDLLGE